MGDGRAGLLLPRPHARDELLTSQLEPRFPFRLELVFDDDLRRDPGVIGSDLPQGIVALHAVIPDQHVHQRVLKGMPRVQGSGDVGRRQLNEDPRHAAFHRWLEKAARFPKRVPLRLDGGGFETLVELHRRWGKRNVQKPTIIAERACAPTPASRAGAFAKVPTLLRYRARSRAQSRQAVPSTSQTPPASAPDRHRTEPRRDWDGSR